MKKRIQDIAVEMARVYWGYEYAGIRGLQEELWCYGIHIKQLGRLERYVRELQERYDEQGNDDMSDAIYDVFLSRR